MLILNIAISIALAYFGAVQLQQDNALGWLLLLCIIVHWSLYASRRRQN